MGNDATHNPIVTDPLARNTANVSLDVAAVAAASSTGISSISGAFAPGNTLTIAGASFGTTGTSVINDDFEDGTVGNNLNTRVWNTTSANGPPVPVVTDTDAFAGTKCGLADCSVGGDSSAYVDSLDTEEVYISIALKALLVSGSPTTTKGVRVHGDAGPNIFTRYPGFMDQEPFDDTSGNSRRLQINPDDASNTNGDSTFYIGGDSLASGEWYREEYYFKHSTPGGSDGIFQLRQDGDFIVNQTALTTRLSGITAKMAVIHMPFYWGNGGGGKWFYDLVSITKGPGCLARFEAADSADWSAKTKSEILWTSARSDTAATVDVPGATTFTSGETVYIFAIGADDAPIGNAVSMEVQ